MHPWSTGLLAMAILSAGCHQQTYLVKDENGMPVPGVRIELEGPPDRLPRLRHEPSVIADAVTDHRGRTLLTFSRQTRPWHVVVVGPDGLVRTELPYRFVAGYRQVYVTHGGSSGARVAGVPAHAIDTWRWDRHARQWRRNQTGASPDWQWLPATPSDGARYRTPHAADANRRVYPD